MGRRKLQQAVDPDGKIDSALKKEKAEQKCRQVQEILTNQTQEKNETAFFQSLFRKLITVQEEVKYWYNKVPKDIRKDSRSPFLFKIPAIEYETDENIKEMQQQRANWIEKAHKFEDDERSTWK